jgi:hypothetical protein
MTSFTQNLNAADDIARSTIQDRRRHAEQRALARAARRQARRTAAPVAHDVPVWAFRFLRPVY